MSFYRRIAPIARRGPAPISAASRAAIILLFIWYLQPVAPFLSGIAGAGDLAQTADDDANAAFLRLSWLPLYAVLAGLILPDRQAVLALFRRDHSLIWLTLFPLLSVLWSIDPRVTLMRAGAQMLAALFGIWLAARFDGRDLLGLLATALALSLGLSLAVILIWPAIGVSGGSHEGAWRGVYAHKNVFGLVCLLGLLVFGLRWADTPQKFRPGLWFGLALFLLVNSKSRTPLAVYLSMLGALWLCRSLRQERQNFWLISCAAAAILTGLALVIAPLLPALLQSMGKDMTLSGRTDIWAGTLLAARAHLWLGYGFGAFWTDTSHPALGLRDALRWHVPNAHSGFIDLILSLGLVGFGIFLVSVGRTAWRAGQNAGRLAAPSAYWCWGFLTLFLAYSVMESSTIAPNSALWILYTATAGLTLIPNAPGIAQPIPSQWSARRSA